MYWHGLHDCIRWDFTKLSQIWGSVCAGNDVSVKPYAHPQPEKVLNHLIYVSHGHGMQLERFYILNQSIMAWFIHFHQVGFHLPLTELGKRLWWQYKIPEFLGMDRPSPDLAHLLANTTKM
jgi:hypothetical protein